MTCVTLSAKIHTTKGVSVRYQDILRVVKHLSSLQQFEEASDCIDRTQANLVNFADIFEVVIG